MGVALGFVFSNQLALRPSVTIPTREGSNEPIFGISVELDYGRRRYVCGVPRFDITALPWRDERQHEA